MIWVRVQEPLNTYDKPLCIRTERASHMLTQHDQDYFTNRDNRMTPIEAAQYLEWIRKTLSQKRYNKKGPAFIKVEERIDYDKRVLDEWLQSRSQVF